VNVAVGVGLSFLGILGIVVGSFDFTHHIIRHGGYKIGHAVIEPWQTLGVGILLLTIGTIAVLSAVRRWPLEDTDEEK
jgi:hypothetical protein